MTRFGYNLRKLREFRNLSPQQIADYLEQSVRTYLKNESGEREPTRLELKLIAEILEITVEELVSLEELSIQDIVAKSNQQTTKMEQFMINLRNEVFGSFDKRLIILESKMADVENQIFRKQS